MCRQSSFPYQTHALQPVMEEDAWPKTPPKFRPFRARNDVKSRNHNNKNVADKQMLLLEARDSIPCPDADDKPHACFYAKNARSMNAEAVKPM